MEIKRKPNPGLGWKSLSGLPTHNSAYLRLLLMSPPLLLLLLSRYFFRFVPRWLPRGFCLTSELA